jgi:hypothetical protein
MKTRDIMLAAATVLVVAGTALAGQQTPPPPPAAPGAQQAATMVPPPPPRAPASPAGAAETQVGGVWAVPEPGKAPRYRDGKWIVVTYNRPILKGRQDIFGAGADYGKTVNGGAPVWRVGANQTTRIKTEAPLVFADKTIAPGEYSVFVDLKDGAWTFILSTQPYQAKYERDNKTATWGSYSYDPKFDVLRVPMNVSSHPISMDEFTIAFVNMTQQGGSLAMFWEKTIATVDFAVAK